jgi:anaerobic selenocysteine-containing dehydrogenase
VLIASREGRLVKVAGDRDNPFNRGRLCPRGLALADTLYSPARIAQPLIRCGERGEGRFKEASWEEALELAAARMLAIRDEHGPEAMLFAQGTGRDVLPYLAKMAYGFGSPNLAAFGPASGNACYQPRLADCLAMTGTFWVPDYGQFHPARETAPEHRDPALVIVWGANPVYSNPDGNLGHWLTDCMRRGTRTIVVDPRGTWLASRSEQWLKLRPGTDAMLALAMLNVVIGEELFDRPFVTRWTHGLDRLAERVRPHSPEAAAEICGVPAEEIRKAARSLATAKPAAIHWGVATDQSRECFATHQALMALWTITGNVDVPGGMAAAPFPFDLPLVFYGQDDLPPGMLDRKLGVDRYPVFRDFHRDAQGDSVLRAIEEGDPYALHGAWFWSTNTVVSSFADPARAAKAFRSLDFVGVVDLFMTPTALAFADVVLPATTFAEKDGIRSWHYQLDAVNQAVERVGQSLPDAEIVRRLGRLTRPEHFPFEDLHAMLDDILAPVGLRFEELRRAGPLIPPRSFRRHESGKLRRDGAAGFETPTGRIELYSTVLEKLGLDPLPSFEEPPNSPRSTPELFRDYPLLLTTGARVPVFFCSEHRNVTRLRRHNPHPLLEIHPEDAARLSIAQGEEVLLESPHGKCTLVATLTTGIGPGVVHAQYGWWFPERDPVPAGGETLGGIADHHGLWRSNVNRLLPSGWQGRSGFGYPFKNQICRVVGTGRVVAGDHECKGQDAKCKVQNGQASWLSATLRLRSGQALDHGPSAFAGRFGGTSSTITHDRRSTRFCSAAPALLVDRRWCFGCLSCQLACQQEHGLPAEEDGIVVGRSGPAVACDGLHFEFDPVPTSRCDLCQELARAGRKPACVAHCQAGCLRAASLAELKALAARRPGAKLYLAGGIPVVPA